MSPVTWRLADEDPGPLPLLADEDVGRQVQTDGSSQAASAIAPAIAPAGRFDRCWLPRTSSVTGEVPCHELAWGTHDTEPQLWIVNTLFSCLATLDDRHSFVPRWLPPFITQLAPQDRCPLNGVAMRDGSPGFVTVMALTDDPGGSEGEGDRRGESRTEKDRSTHRARP